MCRINSIASVAKLPHRISARLAGKKWHEKSQKLFDAVKNMKRAHVIVCYRDHLSFERFASSSLLTIILFLAFNDLS